MNIADSLSRLIGKQITPSEIYEADFISTEGYIQWVAREATPVALTTRDIERESGLDKELAVVRQCLLDGKWHVIDYKQYLPVQSELAAVGQ